MVPTLVIVPSPSISMAELPHIGCWTGVVVTGAVSCANAALGITRAAKNNPPINHRERMSDLLQTFQTFKKEATALRAPANAQTTAYWTMTWAYIQGCGEHV